MKTRRIIVFVTLSAFVLYVGMRFYAQFRPIKIYVSRVEPMPAELASGLHMEEHKIDPMVTIESPYESAKDKILSMDEIRQIRSQIAWSKSISPLFDSLTIQGSNKVLIRRMNSNKMDEYQLVKEGDRWVVEGSTHTTVDVFQPKKN
jgi:hypothetical protein